MRLFPWFWVPVSIGKNLVGDATPSTGKSLFPSCGIMSCRTTLEPCIRTILICGDSEKVDKVVSDQQCSHQITNTLSICGNVDVRAMYRLYRISRQWKDYHHSLYVSYLSIRSLLVALIKQLPKGYKICLLKNEFGDLKGPNSA